MSTMIMDDQAVNTRTEQVDNGNPPPSVTRGWNSQNSETESKTRAAVGIHWTRLSVPKSRMQELLRIVSIYFGRYEEKNFGFWLFDRSYTWDSGSVTVVYRKDDTDSSPTHNRCVLEVPGFAHDSMDLFQVAAFYKNLADLDPQICRLDLYYDDMKRRITPYRLLNLVYELDADGKVLRHDFSGFRKIYPGWEGGSDGLSVDMVKFGKRGNEGSGKHLRIYDKKLESDGVNPAVRYELELSDEKADKAFWGLVSRGYDLDSWAAWIGGLIGSSVDFVKRTERAGDKNLDRLERYEFWAEILDELGRAVMSIPIPETDIEQKKEHFQNQYTKSLRTFRLALGDEDFYGWLLDLCTGDLGLTGKHWTLIKQYRDGQEKKRLHLAEFNTMLSDGDMRDED